MPDTNRVKPALEAAVRSPWAALTVTVSTSGVLSGSDTVVAANGVAVCASVIDWPPAPPATLGASWTAVTVSVPVSAGVEMPAPSVTTSPNEACSVAPGARLCATGWNTRARTPAWAAAATVPEAE